MSSKAAPLADQPEVIVSSIDRDTLSKAYALRSRKLGEAQARIFAFENQIQADQELRRREQSESIRAIMLRDAKLSKVTEQLYASEAANTQLTADMERRFKELAYLTRRLLSAEGKLEALPELEKKLETLQAEIQLATDRIAARDRTLAEQKSDLDRVLQQVQERDAQLELRQQEIAERDAQLDAYRHSSSWKITGPMRAFKRLLAGERPSLK